MTTRLKLSPDINARLMSFMGRKGISVMDTNIVISRAVDAYLEFADSDKELDEYIQGRIAERVKRGKEARR